MFVRLTLAAVAVLLCASGEAITRESAPAPTGQSETICQSALDWLDSAHEKVDQLIPIAQQAARKLAAGGTLYVAGNPGFSNEMYYRAGGFPFTRVWKEETRATARFACRT